MENTDKLRLFIREEVKKELHEGTKGAILGYLAGVLVDFFLRKKTTSKPKEPEKSADELEKEFLGKLNKKYDTDPEFKEIVDGIMQGRKYRF